MFPSIEMTRPVGLKKLDCLRSLGETQRPLQVKEIAKVSGIPPAVTKRILGALTSLSLISEDAGKYYLTSRGLIALMSMPHFQNFSQVKPILLSLRNDELAFAMLIIGHAKANDDRLLYDTLSGYARHGHNVESVDYKVAADSILRHFSIQARSTSKTVPPYLGMFKDFTPAGVQDILKMLVVAVRPTPDDYNWLIQFFYELVNFYYNPIRMAYANMLASGNQILLQRLANFKKEQEALMKNEGSNVELTFRVIGGFEFEKFEKMPPQLRAMGFKLVLEPLGFMTKELQSAFWPE
jgi:hypothetical protein